MNILEKKGKAETTLFMAKKAEETNAFNAVLLYKQALENFKEINDKENIKICLSKIRLLSIEAQKSFKTFTTTQEIPKEEIDGIMKDFLDAKSIEQALVLFSRHPAFTMDYEDTVNNVVNGPCIAHKICSNVVVNDKGDFVSGGSDADMSMVMQYYFIHEGMVSQVFLTRAWDILLERGLTIEILVDFFKKKLALNEDLLELLENGFSHLFNNDSIATLHVLVPRFEQIMLILSQGLGLEIVALERAKKEVGTRDKMVGEKFMRDIEVQKKFGKNFCEYATFFLFDPLGLNLRNRITHGDVRLIDCNFPHALSMLRLLLTFPANFKIS